MGQKFIDVIIDTEGDFVLETSGFSGGECRTASKSYENELGTVENEKTKAEFHEKPNQERVQAKRGK